MFRSPNSGGWQTRFPMLVRQLMPIACTLLAFAERHDTDDGDYDDLGGRADSIAVHRAVPVQVGRHVRHTSLL